MTDAAIGRIVEHALATDVATLPDAVVHDCKCRLIDTFVCTVADFDDTRGPQCCFVAADFDFTS